MRSCPSRRKTSRGSPKAKRRPKASPCGSSSKSTAATRAARRAIASSIRSASRSRTSTPSAASAVAIWGAGRSTRKQNRPTARRSKAWPVCGTIWPSPAARPSCTSSAASCSVTPWAAACNCPTSRCCPKCKNAWPPTTIEFPPPSKRSWRAASFWKSAAATPRSPKHLSKPLIAKCSNKSLIETHSAEPGG